MKDEFKTTQDKMIAYALYPLFVLLGWKVGSWTGSIIGLFIAYKVHTYYPKWVHGLDLKLVDNAIGNLQLYGMNGSKYCLDFGEAKKLYIYRDNKLGRNNVRLALLINQNSWQEVPLRDDDKLNKVGFIWPCFDKGNYLTAIFPSGPSLDQRKSIMEILRYILEVSGLDISQAYARVDYIHAVVRRNLYSSEGNFRSLLVRPYKWTISCDGEEKLWIETLPRYSIGYKFRELSEMELRRYKYEGQAFLESFPDDYWIREEKQNQGWLKRKLDERLSRKRMASSWQETKKEIRKQQEIEKEERRKLREKKEENRRKETEKNRKQKEKSKEEKKIRKSDKA